MFILIILTLNSLDGSLSHLGKLRSSPVSRGKTQDVRDPASLHPKGLICLEFLTWELRACRELPPPKPFYPPHQTTPLWLGVKLNLYPLEVSPWVCSRQLLVRKTTGFNQLYPCNATSVISVSIGNEILLQSCMKKIDTNIIQSTSYIPSHTFIQPLLHLSVSAFPFLVPYFSRRTLLLYNYF